MRARWARAGFVPYPWWIPVVMNACSLAAVAVTVAQRLGTHPTLPVTGLALVAATPWVLDSVAWRVPWPVFTVMVTGSAAVLMALYPVDYDFAVFLLVMMAGHLGATERIWASAGATAVASVTVIALELSGEFDGSKFSLAALLVGWDVGFVMQYQQRRIEEQKSLQASRETQVVSAERQRIAREVHDVIAHSLSVTMLHLTAARRGLEDDPHDVQEAVEALREAERLGRQSMTDIRRTVGMLGSGSREDQAPAAGLEDVPALVEQYRRAGLDVVYDVHGSVDAVPSSSGLGVYRVVQESLSNVAKHQPDARVRADLEITATQGRLSVFNTLAPGFRAERDGYGSGLRGMRERAQLLGGEVHAGAEPDGWRVQMTFPVGETDRHQCGLAGSSRTAGTEAP